MKSAWSIPAYSQYLDVRTEKWRRYSCGIVALKMTIDYWNASRKQKSPTLAELLRGGRERGYYIPGIGWKHKGLVILSCSYGFRGKNYDLADKTSKKAFSFMKKCLRRGPVIASIYKNFKPGNSGHLVVIAGIIKNKISYNDPIAKRRNDIARCVSISKFLNGWKRRIIVISPKKTLQ